MNGWLLRRRLESDPIRSRRERSRPRRTTLEPGGKPLGRRRLGSFRRVGQFDQSHRLGSGHFDLLERLLDFDLLMRQIGVDELTIGMKALTINETSPLQLAGMPEHIEELRIGLLDLNEGGT
jgi:hypothetical protein